MMSICNSLGRRIVDKVQPNIVSAIAITYRAAHSTAQDLIQDTEIQALLKDSSLSTEDRIPDDAIKMAILKHYTQKYRIPVASNAFQGMETTEDIANWYSYQLRPMKNPSHGHKILLNTVGKQVNNDHLDDDAYRQTQRKDEILSELPTNLRLDEKAFRIPQFSLKQKRVAKRRPNS